MENMLEVRFEEKRIKDVDGEIIDMLFKGFRCTDDVMYRFLYALGYTLDLDDVYVSIEKEEDVDRWRIHIPKDEANYITSDSYDDNISGEIINEGLEKDIESDICDN